MSRSEEESGISDMFHHHNVRSTGTYIPNHVMRVHLLLTGAGGRWRLCVDECLSDLYCAGRSRCSGADDEPRLSFDDSEGRDGAGQVERGKGECQEAAYGGHGGRSKLTSNDSITFARRLDVVVEELADLEDLEDLTPSSPPVAGTIPSPQPGTFITKYKEKVVDEVRL
jgi:hypothetical protein